MIKKQLTGYLFGALTALVIFITDRPLLGQEIQFVVSKINLPGQINFVMDSQAVENRSADIFISYTPDQGKQAGSKVIARLQTPDGLRYSAQSELAHTLDQDIGTIDFGDLNKDGRDDLIATKNGRIEILYQKEDGKFPQKSSLQFACPYNLPYSRKKVFQYDFLKDLNHDQKPDIFIPTIKGYALVAQDPQGRFPQMITQNINLDYSSSLSVYGQYLAIEYNLPIPSQIDINKDGMKDLVFSDGNTFTFFPFQPEEGKYGPAVTIKIPVERKPFGSLHAKVDEINGDGLPDIIIMRVSGKKILTNEIFLFKGQTGLVYPQKEDQLIHSEGAAQIPFIQDLNGDGKKELVTSSVKIGLSFFVDYFLRNRIGIDVSIYCLGQEQLYDEKPAKVRRLYFKTEEEEGSPAVQQGDFNNDGLKDFVLATHPDRLSFYLANPREFLSDKPACEVNVPAYGRITVRDFNGDGRDDMAIIYPVEKRKGDVTLLISAGD